MSPIGFMGMGFTKLVSWEWEWLWEWLDENGREWEWMKTGVCHPGWSGKWTTAKKGNHALEAVTKNVVRFFSEEK